MVLKAAWAAVCHRLSHYSLLKYFFVQTVMMMKSYEGNRDFPLKALWSGWQKTGTLITVLINMSECGVLLGFASFTSARGL